MLMIKRPSTGIFPDLHVFPGGHLEKTDFMANESKIYAMKICAIRETVEETGVWPFSEGLENFDEIKKGFNSFLLHNKINMEYIIRNLVHEWMCWRTPDFKSIYPQQWDMQMLVSKSEVITVNENFSSSEIVEVSWFTVEEILQSNKSNEIHLAPPQYYMLKQIEKYGNASKLIESIKKLNHNTFIQPKLLSSRDGLIWHSILPKDRFYSHDDASIDNLQTKSGPFHRITMKRDGEKFHDFALIEE